jgi:hypothetical protein
MAYMSQERKNELAPKIKAVLKKYGMKGTIRVANDRVTLAVRVKAGKLPIIENFAFGLTDIARSNAVLKSRCLNVNPVRIDQCYTGNCKKFLKELIAAMNDGNHDRSDIMTDYFDVGWYTDISIGDWNIPYEMVK